MKFFNKINKFFNKYLSCILILFVLLLFILYKLFFNKIIEGNYYMLSGDTATPDLELESSVALPTSTSIAMQLALIEGTSVDTDMDPTGLHFQGYSTDNLDNKFNMNRIKINTDLKKFKPRKQDWIHNYTTIKTNLNNEGIFNYQDYTNRAYPHYNEPEI